MAMKELEQILKDLIFKLQEECPKSVKTSLSLIDKFKDRLTKHRKKRIERILEAAIYGEHGLVEIQYSNKEHFTKEDLDELITLLIKQVEWFKELNIGKWTLIISL